MPGTVALVDLAILISDDGIDLGRCGHNACTLIGTAISAYVALLPGEWKDPCVNAGEGHVCPYPFFC